MAFAAEFNLDNFEGGTDGFIVRGIESDEFRSFSLRDVGSARDFNGDGFDDILLRDKVFNTISDDTEGAGRNFVVFGSEVGISEGVELASLDGTDGFIIEDGEVPPNQTDELGFSGDSAGDFNGDGFDDLVLGNSDFQGARYSTQDVSYVVFGTASGFDGSLALSDLDGTNGFAVKGGNGIGYSASELGDVNGDGFDDVVLGTDGQNGRSYVLFGGGGGFDAVLEDPDSLDGTNGFILQGEAVSLGAFDFANDVGETVSGAGDVNNDGLADIAIGSPDTDQSFVVFGRESGLDSLIELNALDGTNGFVINGESLSDSGTSDETRDGFGKDISSVGDVNGDSVDDLLITASLEGLSYVVFGREGGFDSGFNVADLNGSNGFAIAGVESEFADVSGAGDINADGINDIIISDPGQNQSFVVFGQAGGFSSRLDLTSLDGSNGFVISGIGTPEAASGAGDVNGDGIGDVAVVDSANSTAFVIYGQASNSTEPTPDIPGPESRESLNPVSGGTAGNDGITGTDEGDFIQGLAGNDALLGGGEGDFLDGGEGIDTAVYQFDTTGITADLTTGFAIDGSGSADGLFNIENVIGSDFADEIRGNGSANGLTGRDGDDRIEGEAGDDTLLGGIGADELVGGAGADRYLYLDIAEGGDTITDFEVGSDKLILAGAAFGELTSGELSAEQFFVGEETTSSGSRIGYRPSSGEVLFGADGIGSGQAQVIATLLSAPKFSNRDVNVI